MLSYLKYLYFLLRVRRNFSCTAIASLGVNSDSVSKYFIKGVISDGCGGLAWTSREDLKHFSSTTSGRDCIVGENTLKTLEHVKSRGRRWILAPLKDDTESSVNRRKVFVEELHSEELTENLWEFHTGGISYREWKELELDVMRPNVYVIGGPTTYAKMYYHINKLDLTLWYNKSIDVNINNSFTFGYYHSYYQIDSKPLAGDDNPYNVTIRVFKDIPSAHATLRGIQPVRTTNVIRRIK